MSLHTVPTALAAADGCNDPIKLAHIYTACTAILHKATTTASAVSTGRSTDRTADAYARPKVVRALKLVFSGLLQAANGYQRPPPPLQLRALTELLLTLQQRLVKQTSSSADGTGTGNNSSSNISGTSNVIAAHCDLLDCECPQHWDTPFDVTSTSTSTSRGNADSSSSTNVPSLGLDDLSETCVALSWCSSGSDETDSSVTADSATDGISGNTSVRMYDKSLVTAYSTEEAFNNSYSCAATAAAATASSSGAYSGHSSYRRGRHRACMTLQMATTVSSSTSSINSSSCGVFTVVAWSLTDDGCFTVEGLMPDTRYFFRLAKTPQLPLSR
jgi:hypothetical protein